MSSLTQCNYCSLRDIRRRARKEKKRVVLLPSSFMGGTNVFVVPKEIKKKDVMGWKGPSDNLPNGDSNYERYKVSWMMEVPDHCCC